MSGKSQTIAAQRKTLRKRNWVYYALPYLDYEASCRSCGSGNIMFRAPREKETRVKK